MDIDVLNPEIYQHGVPHEDFKRLRRESPIYWHKEPHGRGFWAITKHRDVVTISRDPHTFSSMRGATFLEDYEEESEDMTAMRFIMLNMDPPQHVKFRNIVKRGFVPKMVQALEPAIRLRVHHILDGLAAGNQCDFLEDVARQLPLHVIAEMLGVPYEDRAQLFHWSDLMVEGVGGPLDDPEIKRLKEDSRVYAMQIWSYAGELAQKRYDKPGDDIISLLMHGAIDGEQLSPMEFAAFFMLLLVAGNETTRNLLANGMLALIEHPEERQKLIADPSLIPSAVEEMLRWAPSIIYFRRTVMRDTVLSGQAMREGDKLAMFYPSANRDEDVFEEPDRFNVSRTHNDQLAFGTGQHICLGAGLARLEVRIMFEELLRRFPDMELCGEVKRSRSNFVHGITKMPVRYSSEQSLRTASL